MLPDSPHDVDVAVQVPVEEAVVGALRADAHRALQALSLEASELSVSLVDDPGIRGLNATWRGKDTATDVLSFPQQDGEVGGGLLGDLVISVDTAARQAAEQGHDLATELRVLLVHGLCHLIGHDHHAPDETARMRSAESGVLAALHAPASGLVDRAHGG